MGNGITVSCTNCSYRNTFMLGVGMAYYSLRNVIDNITGRTAKTRILKILEHCKVNKTDFNHNLYRCTRCDGLFECFLVELNYDDNQIYKTEFLCPTCDIPLEHIENEEGIKDFPCPSCKNKSLRAIEEICWD